MGSSFCVINTISPLKLSIFDGRISNKFIFDDEREARSEREIGLFIKTRQDPTIRRKVTSKKQVKFAIFLDGFFICSFQFSY